MARAIFISGLCLIVLSLAAAMDVPEEDGTQEVDGRKTSGELLMGTRAEIRFNTTFKIAVFADLHYGENAWDTWGPAQDLKSSVVMSNLLDRETPDFVVFNGDVLTANNLLSHNATQYWQQAVGPTVTRNIPWASVLGNHDDAAFVWDLDWFGPSGLPPLAGAGTTDVYFQGTTRAELLAFDINAGNSYTQQGPQTLWPSLSNYAIPILSSTSGAPATILYFLDSGGGSYPEEISAAQAAWFEKLASELNPDNSIPEIVFWHIPSIAYSQVGPIATQTIQPPCFGSINYEGVATQQAEWGIMDILSNRTSIRAVFVGHNHGLDWCCPYKSLWLCFCRHTGYGGYGSWIRGGRIIELTENPFQITTWVTLEDGTVTQKVKM